MEATIPQIIQAAWQAYGDRRELVSAIDISATVSTNHVYRVVLEDKKEFIAKISSFGSYVHFKQDHQRINRWSYLLSGSRYTDFLAPVFQKDGKTFTYRDGDHWTVFYEKSAFYDFLPKVLTDEQVESFGAEMAHFHKTCDRISHQMDPSWKTLGSDVAHLFDVLTDKAWVARRGLSEKDALYLREQCEVFLQNADDLGYNHWTKIPVLIDWNIGNFSVGFDREGFKFFSRWDYDWFRIESRTMDFYFCSRVVRNEGDKTAFSYTPEPFFEERFAKFLRAYHRVHPLTDNEILFLKEMYRFFLLNYVILSGEYFFKSPLWERLQNETVTQHLPNLDSYKFEKLLSALDGIDV